MPSFIRQAVGPVLSLSLLAGCTSNRPIGTPFPEGYTLVSEQIDIETKDGQFIMTSRIEVRDDSLFTDRRAFDLLEIESITERRFSPEKSGLLLGGLTVLALGVVYTYFVVKAVSRSIISSPE